MIDRALAEAVFADAVRACDPARLVREAVAAPALAGWLGGWWGLAVGKAALAMARGAGPVARGLVIAPVAGEVPAGWDLIVAAHPVPDARSVRAGAAALALFEDAAPPLRVLALVSGGASSLLEVPRGDLAALVATTSALAAAGAPIAELNAVRTALSAIKGGQLAARCAVPIATLAISDVVGDDPAVIGSGPTVRPPGAADLAALRAAGRSRAGEILDAYGVARPAALRARAPEARGGRATRALERIDGGAGEGGAAAAEIGAETAAAAAAATAAAAAISTELAVLLAPLAAFAEAAHAALVARGVPARLLATPLVGDVHAVAAVLAATSGPLVAWGEPTVRLPAAHGQGGRAQQLALALAALLRGGTRSALVIGSDGVDGPAPTSRPTPAGAFVDGTTWDAIEAAEIDPAAALARCAAGPALAAVGALVVTGPTGVNHADLVLIA